MEFPKATKLKEFLRYKTDATELCVVCDPWRIATFWIDHEDLFLRYIHPDIANKYVVRDEWEPLTIVDQDGNKITVMAHHIYI